MNINQTIDLLNCNTEDKNILKEIVLSRNIKLYETLSFFSKRYTTKKLKDYTYIQTNPEDYVYYCCNQPSVFLDNDKKIIFNSKWWFNNSNQPLIFIEHIGHVLIYYNKLNIDDCVDISNNLIAIQSWFCTYGHFKDELFNLCDFYLERKERAINDVDYTILYDYPLNFNYNTIKHKLFNQNLINPETYLPVRPLLRFKNLILIEHNISSPTFHRFPENIRYKMLNSCTSLENEITYTNCFITRSTAGHLPRNLSNQKEIEDFTKSLDNFSVINPENISLDELMTILQHQKLVIITWGSALINLMYLKPNTNVIILQSKSYAHESIALFKHIVKNLNIHIIKHNNNIIDTKLIIESIDNFKTKA
jgi:hypothetical protein